MLKFLLGAKKENVFKKCHYNIIVKPFCVKTKKEEILLYVMQDKYSVKPDKEFRIHHTTIEKITNHHQIKIEGEIFNKSDSYKPHQVISYGKHSITEISSIRLKLQYRSQCIKRKVISKICPRDYPYSVKKGYAEFSKYNLLSNVCFNAMNFITTQVLINSLNLNISKSTGLVFSAGMNWAIKEGIGQMGSILFTTKYSQKIERSAKSWRVKSSILGSISFLLESTTILFPKYFLFIATSSNILKLVSLNSTIISRTSMIENLSKQNNIVDLSNKFGLHNNISILFGNLIGFAFSLLVPLNSFSTIFPLLATISIYNIYTSYTAVQYIQFDYLNFQRMSILCEEYLKSKSILSPEEISLKETILFKKYTHIHFCNKSPEIIIKGDNHLYVVQLFNLFREKNFFVIVKKKFSMAKMKSVYTISTFLRVNAENNDIFWALLFTFRLSTLLDKRSGHILTNEIVEIMEENLTFIDELDKKQILEKLKSTGWSLNFHHMEEAYSRYHLLYKNL